MAGKSFSANQVKELLEMHENTIIKFFNSTVERLEKKVDKISAENSDLRNEIALLKEAMDFQEKIFEDKMKEMNQIIENTRENKARTIEKMAELEDRSRRNNLRIDGIKEESDETWEETEQHVKEMIKNKLELNEKKVVIERAHRVGKKGENTRTIIAKFLNYKDKVTMLNRYKEKQLWQSQIYINEDFSEYTAAKRKELFKQAKQYRDQGKFAKVIYNRLVVSEHRSRNNNNEA